MSTAMAQINDFFKRLDWADKRVREGAEQGMAEAGAMLLNDSTMEIPRTPVDKGTLRGSGSVFVSGKLKKVSPKVNGKGDPATTAAGMGTHIANAVEAQVGYNTPYAARLHEHPEFLFGFSRSFKSQFGVKNSSGKYTGTSKQNAGVRKRAEAAGTGGKYLESKMSAHREKYMGHVAAKIEQRLANA